jgi:transcriptional regulator with GAF, ATPase, and Fis domain
MQQALERTGGVQIRAAELLRMSERSFRYYAKKYGIRREGEEAVPMPEAVEEHEG